MNKNILLTFSVMLVIAFYNTNCAKASFKTKATSKNDCVLIANDSIPALHAAVLKGAIDEVQCIIGKGVDIMELDDKGETALMYACKKDPVDYEIVALLIEHGSKVFDDGIKSYETALHICIDHSRDSLMQILLNNLSDEEKQLVREDIYYMFISIGNEEPKIVKQLIPFQISLDTVNPLGDSYLQTAVHHAEILNGILLRAKNRNDVKPEDLDAALEVIDILISNGAKLNESDLFSEMVSIAFKGAAVTETLIRNGLNVNKQVATRSGKHNLLDLFLDQIASKKVYDYSISGINAAKVKEVERYLEVLDLMLERGAKGTFEEVTAYEQLAIIALDKFNAHLLSVLLDAKKVDVNFKDAKGKTLLMRAEASRSYDRMKIIELLKKYN